MATIPGVIQTLSDGVKLAIWADMDDTDVGSAAAVAGWADRTVQAVGDATSVAIEGSNDGTNWVSLSSPSGDPIGVDGAGSGMAYIVENPLYIRPAVTGGTATTVIVCGVTDR